MLSDAQTYHSHKLSFHGFIHEASTNTTPGKTMQVYGKIAATITTPSHDTV